MIFDDIVELIYCQETLLTDKLKAHTSFNMYSDYISSWSYFRFGWNGIETTLIIKLILQ